VIPPSPEKRRSQMTLKLSQEDFVEKFSAVCDVVERNYHGWPLDDPNDPWSHTSEEARAAAVRIFEIFGVEERTTPFR